MSDKIRKLCKWSKGSYTKDLKVLKKVVASPVYYCEDCGRVANDRKVLCEPEKL